MPRFANRRISGLSVWRSSGAHVAEAESKYDESATARDFVR